MPNINKGRALAANTRFIDLDSRHGAFDHELKEIMVQGNRSAVFHGIRNNYLRVSMDCSMRSS